MKGKKTIYIGGTKYFFKRVDEIKKDKGRFAPNITIYGQFRPKSNEIVCIRDLGLQYNNTVIHELLHAIDREFSGSLSEMEVDIISRELSGSLQQLGMLN